MNKKEEQLQKLIHDVNALSATGEWSAVVAKWDEIIPLLPDNLKSAAYNNRGNAKNVIGDYEGAIADCDLALGINSRFAEAYNNRGNAKSGAGRDKEAIADYDQALEINPRDAGIYNNRGSSKDSMGNYAGAIADYDQALEINPQLEVAYSNRGNTKGRMGNYKEAIADFDKALKINPRYVEAYANRGNAKDSMGNYADAITDYDQALKINPQVAGVYYNRGNVKGRMGNYEGAIADYDQAIIINPQEAIAYYNRGNAKIRVGDHTGAAADYKQVLAINPKHKKALEALSALALKPRLDQGAVGGGQDESVLKRKEKFIKIFMGLFAVVSMTLFGLILGWGYWLMKCSLAAGKIFNSYFLLPYAFIATLFLTPLMWVINTLKEDKTRYWELWGDDAERKAKVQMIRLAHPEPNLPSKNQQRPQEPVNHRDLAGDS